MIFILKFKQDLDTFEHLSFVALVAIISSHHEVSQSQVKVKLQARRETL